MHQYESDRFHRRLQLQLSPPTYPPRLRRLPSSSELTDYHLGDSYRFMAMLRFPTLDLPTGTLDWGVSCQACRLNRYAPRHKRRGYFDWMTVYSTSGYSEHFQQCELSQKARAVASKYTGPDSKTQPARKNIFLGYLRNLGY
jgi:hypothetical protein